MIKVSIILFFLGLIFLLSTLVTFKRNIKANYSKTKIEKFINKFKSSKLITLMINENDSSNKKLIKKLQVIIQCSQAEEINKNRYRFSSKQASSEVIKIKSSKEMLKSIYLMEIGLFIVVCISGFFIKSSLNNMVVRETLNSASIHNLSNYKINTSDASSILKYIGEDYKKFIVENNIDGLKEVIYDFVVENKLNLDQDDIYIICDTYIQAYDEGHFNLKEIIIIIIISTLSTLLVKLYVNIRYKIYNIKLISEFYSMELLALLHMNRDELNVYEILTELNKYSIYLKPYLTRCLNRYSSNPVIALDKLMKEVNDENFSSFILILKSCLDKSKNINSEVLKLQRKLRFLNEKLDNDKSLEFKELWLTIAQFPLILMFVLDLLMPFLSTMNINNII
ncbi:MAG: hypothetical protein E7E64_04880 [Clostridium celatum]|nr:hypothetical protein [Clostridium celatum]